MNLTPVMLLIVLTLLCLHDGAAAAENGATVEASAAKNLATVGFLVYKKWIGAEGNEANVEIRLSCGDDDDFTPRFINRDRPDGWQIEHVPENGMRCSVNEIERETFVADSQDCRNLLVVPGQDVECTMVNTKVVKRIEMLNRYGLGMMIIVMLTAGLVAVRKFS